MNLLQVHRVKARVPILAQLQVWHLLLHRVTLQVQNRTKLQAILPHLVRAIVHLVAFSQALLQAIVLQLLQDQVTHQVRNQVKDRVLHHRYDVVRRQVIHRVPPLVINQATHQASRLVRIRVFPRIQNRSLLPRHHLVQHQATRRPIDLQAHHPLLPVQIQVVLLQVIRVICQRFNLQTHRSLYHQLLLPMRLPQGQVYLQRPHQAISQLINHPVSRVLLPLFLRRMSLQYHEQVNRRLERVNLSVSMSAGAMIINASEVY